MGVVPPPPGVSLLEEAVVIDVETESRRGVPSSAMTRWRRRHGTKKLRFVVVVLCIVVGEGTEGCEFGGQECCYR
jgi:hypothetical protein